VRLRPQPSDYAYFYIPIANISIGGFGMFDFQSMKDVQLDSVDADSLTDIKDVSVDRNLSKEERIAEFVRQIGNPYCFKCGKFVVKARFSDNGVSLEDCLQGILL